MTAEEGEKLRTQWAAGSEEADGCALAPLLLPTRLQEAFRTTECGRLLQPRTQESSDWPQRAGASTLPAFPSNRCTWAAAAFGAANLRLHGRDHGEARGRAVAWTSVGTLLTPLISQTPGDMGHKLRLCSQSLLSVL